MIYKVGLFGASGRMGLEIASLLRDGYRLGSDVLELADVVSRTKRLTSIEGVEVRTLEETRTESVHVWIDFSTPSASLQLMERIVRPLVIGTTGFTDEQTEEVHRFSLMHPVLMASNMSFGMNLMMSVLEKLPSAPGDYDVVLTEEHHKWKKDSPSGSAKTLLNLLERSGYSHVQVHSTRAGGKKGTHSVKFVAEDEEIEIRHEVFDRRIFAKGALTAALFIAKKKEPGLFSMRDVYYGGENEF